MPIQLLVLAIWTENAPLILTPNQQSGAVGDIHNSCMSLQPRRKSGGCPIFLFSLFTKQLGATMVQKRSSATAGTRTPHCGKSRSSSVVFPD